MNKIVNLIYGVLILGVVAWVVSLMSNNPWEKFKDGIDQEAKEIEEAIEWAKENPHNASLAVAVAYSMSPNPVMKAIGQVWLALYDKEAVKAEIENQKNGGVESETVPDSSGVPWYHQGGLELS